MWAAGCLASCCASCACGACQSVVSGISRKSARIAYCGLFALSLIVAWILREVAAPLMEKIPWINHFYETPDREWFETDAVLRVSLGNFLFFSILSLIMVGVKNQKDPRDSIHHGGWMMKVICVDIENRLRAISPCSSCALAGLCSQLECTTGFHHDEQFWVSFLNIIPSYIHPNFLSAVCCLARFVSLVCYLATFFFSGVLFYLFTPSGEDCGLNTFFIVMTLILVFVFAIITLHPTVSGSILPASVISLYCMYLCYSGLASEPRDYACNGLHKHSKAVSTGTLTVGLH
ncbi:probable serine incorporator [Tanacetum coccineum]